DSECSIILEHGWQVTGIETTRAARYERSQRPGAHQRMHLRDVLDAIMIGLVHGDHRDLSRSQRKQNCSPRASDLGRGRSGSLQPAPLYRSTRRTSVLNYAPLDFDFWWPSSAPAVRPPLRWPSFASGAVLAATRSVFARSADLAATRPTFVCWPDFAAMRSTFGGCDDVM